MGSHALLISVKYRKALNTTIPMELVDQFRKSTGFPVPLDREAFKVFFDMSDPDAPHTLFMDFYEDFVIETDNRGTLSALDVAFDPRRERGYFFYLNAW